MSFFSPEQPRHITQGAFKDRLGLPLVVGITASAHPLVQGLREFIAGRSYIDLDRADLKPSLLQLLALSLPEGVPGVPGSGPITAADLARIVDTPVTEDERP